MRIVLGDEPAERLASIPVAAVAAELERAASRDIAVLTREHPAWPPLLREIPDGPWALWVRGALPDPARPTLALVGPRRPSPYGLTVTRELASGLARAGVVLVSGGARGVDGQAHRSALDAGAPTVAVLGCGVDVAYPPEHRGLFERIGTSGAVVSEHPCGAEPRPHHFPVRNRILAGWTRAVLVTEASLQSGSLITARLALEDGRDVLAVPGPITSPLSEGTNALIADGARLVQGLADVLDELGICTEQARTRAAGPEDPVLAVLPRGEAIGLDDLAGTAGLEAGELLARLTGLEARGLVMGLPGGLWLRA